MNVEIVHNGRLIAKIQRFSDMIESLKQDAEFFMMTCPPQSCDKEKARTKICLCEEIADEFHHLFSDVIFLDP